MLAHPVLAAFDPLHALNHLRLDDFAGQSAVGLIPVPVGELAVRDSLGAIACRWLLERRVLLLDRLLLRGFPVLHHRLVVLRLADGQDTDHRLCLWRKAKRCNPR